MGNPSCYGNYKGRDGDVTLEPIGDCRRCQPFRRCRDATKRAFINGFREKIHQGEMPPCWGQYPRGGWVCALCPLKHKDQCAVATAERVKREVVQKEERKELAFIESLQRKMQETWGDDDQ